MAKRRRKRKNPTLIKHGWIIDKEYDYGALGISNGTSICITGPRGVPFSKEELLKHGLPFRLYDDDGELYYSGKVIEDPDDGETILSPLDNYGTPNAGCTTMKMLIDGSWKAIN